MTHIQVNQLSLKLSSDLFSDLSFSLHSGDRLGLVAANGRGKSSLLSILTRELDATTGEVTMSRGATIGVMEQAVPASIAQLSMRETIAQKMPEAEREANGWQVDALLAEFETPLELIERPVSALSGGWQRITLLARAWINQPDILMMDEPTNHLDLEKIIQLENWLNWAVGDRPLIMASHDRAFLDRVTNATLFLRPKNSRYFKLPYGDARAALEELDEADARHQRKELHEVKRLRDNAAKLKNVGLNSGSDLLTVKAKQLRERAEKIEDGLKELYKEKHGDVQLANRGTHAKVLVALEDVTVQKPDGEKLFGIEKQFVFQGDRIVLLGRNGTGKSRLISLIDEAVRAARSGPAGDSSGAATQSGVRATPTAAFAYFDQELSFVPDDLTPFAYISGAGKQGDHQTRAMLAKAGFSPQMQTARISKLSYGQKSRLGLLALRLEEPNFYLLDEPTNHIDIPGQEALEAELKERGATCVLVSHDREFVRNVGTRFWEIEGKRLVERDDPERFFASLEG